MEKRMIGFYITLTVAIAVIVLLIAGSSILTKAVGEGIPLGTFITWAGMISLPLAVYFGVKDLRQPDGKLTRILAGVLQAMILLAILWAPIAYLLAGNLAFNFSNQPGFQGGQTAMRLFWVLSYGIGIGTIATLLVYYLSLLIKKNKAV